MQQIYDAMLTMLQTTGVQTPAKSEDPVSQTDVFRKLMQQAGESTPPSDSSTSAEQTPEQPGAEQSLTDSTQEDGTLLLQAQMAWAAFSFQRPTVVVQQSAPETVAAVTAVAAQAPSGVQTAAAQAGQLAQAPAAAPVQQSGVPAEEAAQARGVTTAVAQSQGEVQPQIQPAAAQQPQQQEAQNGQQQSSEQSLGQATVKVETDGVEQMPQPVFRDVESAPIKVGDAAPAAETAKTQDVEQQLAGKLSNALQKGDTQVKIQLEPANLGSVQVQITHSQNGTLHVVLSAENVHTQGLLERSAAGLQGLLMNSTTQNVQVEVQRQQESQQNDFYDGHNGHDQNSEQQERHQRQSQQRGQDFLQQLRLGLIPLDGEAS